MLHRFPFDFFPHGIFPDFSTPWRKGSLSKSKQGGKKWGISPIFHPIKRLLPLTLTFTAVFTQNAYGQNLEITVGYVENYGIQLEAGIPDYEGYLYEYLEKIALYAPEDITFIYQPLALEEGLETLRQGEIDIIAPLLATPDRLEEFAYTALNFGNEITFLSVLTNHNTYYGDLSPMDGSVILVQEGNGNVDFLQEFLDKKGYTCEILSLDEENMVEALEMGLGDYCLTSSMDMDNRLKAVAKIDESPIYFVSLPENQEILDILDRGHQKMLEVEYLFPARLYLKYYDVNMSDYLYISAEELSLLQEKDVYRVGVYGDLPVLSYLDQSGNPTGVLVDLLQSLGGKFGLDLRFIPVSHEDIRKELPVALEVDFSSDEDENVDENVDKNVDENPLEHTNSPEELLLDMYLFPVGESATAQSRSLLDLPLLLLKSMESTTFQTIGIVDYYTTAMTQIEAHYPQQNVVVYPNYEALHNAYLREEVDAMILTTVSLNTMGNLIDLEKTSMIPIVPTLQFPLYYGDSISGEIREAWNKIITHLDESQGEYGILQHSTQESTVNWWDHLQEHPEVPTLLIGLTFVLVRYEEVKKKKALQQLIDYDDVTGLFTERKFIDYCEGSLKEDKEKKYSLVAFDIDNFKYINELYGYEAGTEVLKAMGRYIQKSVPTHSPVARSFSDNFLVFVETTLVEDGLEKHLSSTQDFSLAMVNLLGESYPFGFSIGIYHIENPKDGLSYMIDCCNLARGLGKKTVGTTVHIFSQEMNEERVCNNEIVASMDQAVAMGEFEMYFQPKFTLGQQNICGAEALVRWFKEGNMISPGEFIPLFEKNGFIEKLDYYVFEEVCRFIATHESENLPRISLNLSGITLMKPRLLEDMIDILQKYQVKPQQLEIEVTESAFEGNFTQAMGKIQSLRLLGFTISMDDFGTGISSLHRLKEMPIDVLKIDRAFVVDSLTHEKGKIIIGHIIAMAKDLQLEIVAEGIETGEQCQFLQGLSCHVGQGYYYSRPLQGQDFIQRLRQDRLQIPMEHAVKLKNVLK